MSAPPIELLAFVVPAALVIAALMALVTPSVLATVREPSVDQLDGGPAPGYARLGTPGFRLVVGVTAAAATIVIGLRVEHLWWSGWAGMVTVGSLLAVIDARTTWLPRSLTVVLWVLTGAGVLASLIWSAVRGAPWRTAALQGVGSAVVLTGVLFLVWWLSRGALGFGDVRIAPVLGGLAGLISVDTAIATAVLGSLIGAVIAVVRLLRRRREPFPYAPALIAGCYLAVLLTG